MSTTYKQILRAKQEFETSLAGARDLRRQWLLAKENSSLGGTNCEKLTKKELDQSTKGLKNKLLAVKWDFEDLEELLGVYKFDNNNNNNNVNNGGQPNLLDLDEANLVEELRQHIGDWRHEIAQMMGQMEDAESSSRLFNKHGITFHNPVSAINSLASGANKYERLSTTTAPNNQQDPDDVVQFDRRLVRESSGEPSIVNNMLYDHLEEQKQQHGGPTTICNPLVDARNSLSDPSQVFNNLSRPIQTNVYMNPNENEMILDMLETEYYNPPNGLLQETGNNSTRIDTMFGKLFNTDRNKFLGTIVFLCSFPTLLILFMIF